MLQSIHVLFARALLALFLITSTGTALAGPVYQVSVDTSSWSGSGYLSLTLSGLANAVPVTATLSNFTGSFGAAAQTQGQVVGDIGAVVTLVQGPSFNELLQTIDFGGMFSFEVGFDVPQGMLDGVHFGVALVNAGLTDYAAGTGGDIAAIALMPGAADGLSVDARFAAISAVTEVPEPGSAAILLLGLLLAGCSRTAGRHRARIRR